MNILKNPFLIIGLAALILVSIWFKNGNIMGTGESGLPFYDFSLQYETVKTTWFDYGLGGAVNVNFASSPTYYVLAQIQRLGIPTFLLQAAFFWICLFIAGSFTYKLTKELFEDIEDKYLILGVFFYWFNPITLVNVWNRFLNNYFIFFAFLPLALFLFIKGIKNRDFKYCYLFILSSAFFSYLHSSMAFNLLLWCLLFYAAFFYLLLAKNFKERFFIIKYFFSFVILWFLTNLWWIAQVFSYATSSTFHEAAESFFTSVGNYSAFSDLSSSLGRLTELFAFRNYNFFTMSDLPWFLLYNFPLIKLLSLLITFLILLGIYLGRKKSPVLFFSLLFFISLFLIKGNNYPLGEIFGWLFLNSTLMQLFRNPFEKFGFLLVLALVPLFIFSISILDKYLKRKIIFWVSAFTLVVIWGLPFWTGLVFTANYPPLNNPQTKYEVIVPKDYKDASAWLKQQKGNFKLVALPLFGEGITYNWEKGFSGIDLTNQIFPVSSVSFDTTVPFYHDIASNIQKVFFENDKFYPVMNALNAKYILVREDINWQQRKMINPQKITEELEKRARNGEFKKAATFGKLTFWENLYYKPSEIYALNNMAVISGKPQTEDLSLKQNTALLSESAGNSIGNPDNFSKIYPRSRLIIREFNQESYAPEYIFPYVSTYPDSKKYQLILIKEKIQGLFITDLKKQLDFKLQLLGKRLNETNKEVEDKNDRLLFSSLDLYFDILSDYEKLYKDYFGSVQSNQKEDIQLEQAEIFQKHLLHLSDLKNSYKENLQVSSKLDSYINNLKIVLAALEIYPQNELVVSETFPLTTRLIYKYQVPADEEYRLLIKDKELLQNFQIENPQIFLQINDSLKTITPEWTKDNLLYLGTHFLKKGENEISFNTFQPKNLIKEEDFNLQSTASDSSKGFPISNIITDRKYDISFDYLIKKGSGPMISLYNDNSVSLGEGKKIPESFVEIRPDYYDFDKKNFGFSTGALYGATSSELVFILSPWKSCGNSLLPEPEWCQDNRRSISFDRQSEISISNLLVTEQFTETPYLEKVKVESSQLKSPQITYTKISDTEYEVMVKNAEENFMLVLAQLYDTGWSLKNENGKKFGNGPILVNIFSNGWIVDKQGNYKLVLEYEPQKRLETTSKISIVTLLVITALILWKTRKAFFRK